MTEITSCPACAGIKFSDQLLCKDYTVSHETFKIKKCESCTLIVTSPQPETKDLSRYYESQEYISHSNKSESLFDKLYQISRVLMLNWKWSLVRKFSTSTTPFILDYGCGTGHFLEKAKSKKAKIHGVEPSPKARSFAETLLQQKLHEDLNSVDEQFDVITLWHVLEHVPDLNTTLGKLNSLLKKNGTIFIAVPNHISYDAKKYQDVWAAYDVPRHLWHFNPSAMNKILENHSLKIKKIIPMKLDAFYVSILSEEYKSKKKSMMNLIKGFIVGFQSNLKASTSEYSSLIYVVQK